MAAPGSHAVHNSLHPQQTGGNPGFCPIMPITERGIFTSYIGLPLLEEAK